MEVAAAAGIGPEETSAALISPPIRCGPDTPTVTRRSPSCKPSAGNSSRRKPPTLRRATGDNGAPGPRAGLRRVPQRWAGDRHVRPARAGLARRRRPRIGLPASQREAVGLHFERLRPSSVPIHDRTARKETLNKSLSARTSSLRTVAPGSVRHSPLQMLVIPSGIAVLCALQPIPRQGARICGDLFSVSVIRKRRIGPALPR